MTETIGGWHRDEVEMQVLEAFGWDGKVGDGWDDMLLDFGLLTGHTFPCPFAHIMLYIGPNKLFGDGLARALNTWVAEAMDDVKNAASVRERHERTGRAVGNINEEKS